MGRYWGGGCEQWGGIGGDGMGGTVNRGAVWGGTVIRGAVWGGL